jgi:hypothetical protein
MRTERDAVAQDGVRLPVELVVAVHHHLRRQLLPCKRDHEVRPEGRLLSENLVGGRGAVHPHGRREDRASDTGAPARLPYARRSHHREVHRSLGVARRDVHIGHRREVEHGIRALERPHEPVEVEDVDFDVPDVGSVRCRDIQHGDVVPGGDEVIDDVRADETRSRR